MYIDGHSRKQASRIDRRISIENMKDMEGSAPSGEFETTPLILMCSDLFVQILLLYGLWVGITYCSLLRTSSFAQSKQINSQSRQHNGKCLSFMLRYSIKLHTQGFLNYRDPGPLGNARNPTICILISINFPNIVIVVISTFSHFRGGKVLSVPPPMHAYIPNRVAKTGGLQSIHKRVRLTSITDKVFQVRSRHSTKLSFRPSARHSAFIQSFGRNSVFPFCSFIVAATNYKF